jgi:hypothetical protein
MKQVMKAGEVLVITGRGNQSPSGIGVVREAIMALMPSLRRRGVVESWREQTPGSIVVTLAPVTTLLGAPKRNRERERDSVIATPESLAALEPDTLTQLRRLATLSIQSLGVDNPAPFVEEEMQRMFATLTITLPVSTDREGTLQRAIKSAIEELEG